MILQPSVILILGLNCKDECQQWNFVLSQIVEHSGIEPEMFW